MPLREWQRQNLREVVDAWLFVDSLWICLPRCCEPCSNLRACWCFGEIGVIVIVSVYGSSLKETLGTDFLSAAGRGEFTQDEPEWRPDATFLTKMDCAEVERNSMASSHKMNSVGVEVCHQDGLRAGGWELDFDFQVEIVGFVPQTVASPLGAGQECLPADLWWRKVNRKPNSNSGMEAESMTTKNTPRVNICSSATDESWSALTLAAFRSQPPLGTRDCGRVSSCRKSQP